MNNSDQRKRIKVWDLPLRIFHWALVLAIFYAWFSIEILENMEHHFWAGYTILSLMIFRVLWGFFGSDLSRFSSWLIPLRDTPGYFKQLIKETKSPKEQQKIYIAHNPLGILSVIVLLSILMFQAVSGLFATDDYSSGPLRSYLAEESASILSELHHDNFTLIKIFIGLHLIAVLYYQFIVRKGLIGAMFNGNKKIDFEGAVPDKNINAEKEKQGRWWLSLILFLIACAVVVGITLLEPELAADDYYY